MNKKLINLLGVTGIIALISYAAAVCFSPLAYPGYDRLSQAVSDLSAETAPSRMLWGQLSALYGVCSVVCVTCVSVFISERKTNTRLLRIGIYLFTVMNWLSKVGYDMFPLSDSGKDIGTFQETMHIAVTAALVLLSVVSLILIIIAGFGKTGIRSIGIWACIALAMMFIGAVGQGIVPKEYFGVVERFSVFAAVGFNAVLGVYLIRGFETADRT
ncbi:MAG: DUF998 domain-containing protein [Oscillospiraceae bacterium]|nr:DUF998 domain-containing protein [Oscillospiraceae bacterium]